MIGRDRRPAVTHRQAIHPQSCRCPRCTPPALTPDAVRAMRLANRWARLTFVGLALGLGLAFIIDRLVQGPGVLSIFGVS
jgi:hypothetical protein